MISFIVPLAFGQTVSPPLTVIDCADMGFECAQLRNIQTSDWNGDGLPDIVAREVASDGQNTQKVLVFLQNPNSLNEGLLAHWTFDDGTTPSNLAIDASGNGHNGTNHDVSFEAAGRIGGAASFNGSTSLIDTGANIIPVGTVDFTLSAWIKPNSNHDGAFLSTYQASNSSDTGTRFKITPQGEVKGQIGAGSTQEVVQSALAGANTWQHVALIRRYSENITDDQIELYIDGTLKITEAVNNISDQILCVRFIAKFNKTSPVMKG